MTRLRSFGASAGRLRGRACGASATHARLRPCATTATPARLRWFLLVAALGLLAARPAAAQTEVIEYYGHDALGSIRIVFTASGVATARADYEPFGEAVTIAGMPTGPLPAQQFTGQERDGLENQDYFGARYYRPRHGRFSQVDPVYAGLFDPQQWNRYAYARNNPLSFVDPDGRNPTSCFDFAGAVRCVGEGTTVTAPLPRPVTPTSPAQPPDFTAAAAEALAQMNNSCWGEGNSRACGSQGRGGRAEHAAGRNGGDEGPTLDGLVEDAQAVLDLVGLVPGLEAADGINAAIDLLQGDLVGASLSAAAMMPIGGQVATVFRAARSTATRTQFLRQLAGRVETPSWMRPWLDAGRVPPGYNVDHIRPLSIGGPDEIDNMRLLLRSDHILHHRLYAPWRR